MDTGIDWLLDLAKSNLTRLRRLLPTEFAEEIRALPRDTIVHGDPTNVITDLDADLYFIDWDECGLSSRYQDLGHVYRYLPTENPAQYDAFLVGYDDSTVDMAMVRKVAGLGSLAAARWADFDLRIGLGLKLAGIEAGLDGS
jgi:aminoglycoside phosphotransferase